MLIGLHFRRRRENFFPYYLSARERQKGVDAAHAVSAASEERDGVPLLWAGEGGQGGRVAVALEMGCCSV